MTLTNKQQVRIFQLAMVLPAVIVLVGINLIPIINTFVTSLQDYFLPAPDARHFVGLDNYINLFKDERFLNSLRLTLIYSFSVVEPTDAREQSCTRDSPFADHSYTDHCSFHVAGYV